MKLTTKQARVVLAESQSLAKRLTCNVGFQERIIKFLSPVFTRIAELEDELATVQAMAVELRRRNR